MQRLIPNIDDVYIAEPHGFSLMATKKMNNYKYKKNGILIDSGNKNVTRFAKDYKIGNTIFTLIVVCLGKTEKTVEGKLDQVADSIRGNNRLKAMAGVATMTPARLGVKI